MQTVEPNTEQKILDAARDEFVRNGYHGARMQAIADDAGINKAMLHYYFRSKDKLFESIFNDSFAIIIEVVMKTLEKDIPFEEKIYTFADKYISLLVKNPFLPQFVLNEANRNPEFVNNIVNNIFGKMPEKFMNQIKIEIESGNINSFDPRDFIINMIGLCIFPIVAKPVMSKLFNFSAGEYDDFIENRKKTVPQTLLNSIKKS